jgi:DNA-binding GntR family transcriptional regulator
MRYSEGRANLSADLAATIRDLIVDGDLAPGERLNEVRLAAELGVSRTPLREALSRLAAEGAVIAVPRIGFFVKALSVEEFEQIHPIRALLDPEALQLAGIPSKKRLDRLATLDRRLMAAETAGVALALDDEWHHELVADCPNRLLVELIEQFMLRARRYEMAFMRAQPGAPRVTAGHAAILEHLYGGDADAARAALREHLQHGSEPILDWLRSG